MILRIIDFTKLNWKEVTLYPVAYTHLDVYKRQIADCIAVKEPGEHTFEYCKKYLDEIVTVNDDESSTAILALIEQHKLIAEGAGAVAVAAAMFNKDVYKRQRHKIAAKE